MTKKSWVLGLLLVGAVNVTASTPVAMRVEMEPQRQVGEMTEVAVVVQVSPEDRIRIGSNAILRIELDGGTVSSGSPMRAVRLEDDGSARVVVEWPPGEHHLQVEIEDPSKEDTGLWVGTVRIPDLSPEGASPPVAEPEPVSASASAPAPAPASGKPEPVTPQPEPEPESESASAPVPVPAPGEPEPVTPQPEPEPVSESASAPDSPETMTPQETETEDALDAAVAAAGASTVAEAEAPAPEPEPEPLPE
ncbi:MAG: hypothetical protein OEV48_14800, partial [Acidobacteriota bacterium]|nr:hypothetical protein [Acidobacteriota bacterium]